MRVKSFVADGALKVSGETVEDAFDDMVNYAILGKALLREERLLREATVAPLPAEAFTPQFECDECSCGRRYIMHFSRGWGCEDCDF